MQINVRPCTSRVNGVAYCHNPSSAGSIPGDQSGRDRRDCEAQFYDWLTEADGRRGGRGEAGKKGKGVKKVENAGTGTAKKGAVDALE